MDSKNNSGALIFGIYEMLVAIAKRNSVKLASEDGVEIYSEQFVLRIAVTTDTNSVHIRLGGAHAFNLEVVDGEVRWTIYWYNNVGEANADAIEERIGDKKSLSTTEMVEMLNFHIDTMRMAQEPEPHTKTND